jgi:hypothetical protein
MYWNNSPAICEGELLVERDVDRVRRADDEERVAIGRRPHHELGAEIGAGAGPILDDELLAGTLGQPLADQPSGDVGRASRGKGHDHPHRLHRIVESLRAPQARG